MISASGVFTEMRPCGLTAGALNSILLLPYLAGVMGTITTF